MGALPPRPSARHDDRRGLAAGDARTVQARDQRDRGRRHRGAPMTLGFVGLGVMGGRMAKRLLDAGHRVIGYNRTRAKARWLADAGLRLAGSPREVAAQADVVFTLVTDSRALDGVCRGPGGRLARLLRRAGQVALSALRPGA